MSKDFLEISAINTYCLEYMNERQPSLHNELRMPILFFMTRKACKIHTWV